MLNHSNTIQSVQQCSRYLVTDLTNHRHEALLHIYPFLIDLLRQSPPRMSTVMNVSILVDFHKDHDPAVQFLAFHFFFYVEILENQNHNIKLII